MTNISNPQQFIEDHGYTMKQSISGYWRLMRGEDVIFDDSASEDVYDEDSAAYLFASYLEQKEEDAKDYLGALATWNADPFLVEDIDVAMEIAKSVEEYGLGEITDEEEFDIAMQQLDLTADNHPKHIYNNCELTICLEEDWVPTGCKI